jgi:DNA replication and repair protein RecF
MSELSYTFINAVRLTHFRNITYLKLDIHKRITLIAGYNGLGKTNILDALVRLNTSRGLKNQTSKECINVANPHYGWGVGVSLSDGDVIQFGRTPAQEKMIYHLNQSPVTHDILQHYVPILWLSPVGEKLFTQEHQVIRNYIDGLVGLCFPKFSELKRDYDKALKQRLKLLFDNGDKNWLNALEFEIANNALQINHFKNAFLDIFTHSYHAIIADTSGGFPPFKFNILCETMAYKTVDHYQNHLKSMRERDKSSARSLFGIHRSRIHITHTEKNIDIYYCSTGEQKAIISHILLCMNHVLQTHYQAMPIMIFDDALGHYDTKRIGFFYDYIHNACQNQFFLTNTEFDYDMNKYADMNLIHLEQHICCNRDFFDANII